MLLVAAGLFTRSLRNLGRVELGLKTDHVIGFSISPELNGYSPERTALLARRLTEELRALPGVRSVTAAQLATLAGNDMGSNVFLEGAPTVGDSPHTHQNRIGPDYFLTLGIPLVEGRAFSWADDATATKVAVVNETFARTVFPGKRAIGAAHGLRPRAGYQGGHRDRRHRPRQQGRPGQRRRRQPFAYLPYLQDPHLGQLTFYLRTEQDPGRLASALRATVNRLDPQLPVDDAEDARDAGPRIAPHASA